MRSVALYLSALAVILCTASTSYRAEAQVYGVVACQPFPSWYPQNWTLMVRNPCYVYPYVYPNGYGGPGYTFGPNGWYGPRRHVAHFGSRRPYLRPGWWW